MAAISAITGTEAEKVDKNNRKEEEEAWKRAADPVSGRRCTTIAGGWKQAGCCITWNGDTDTADR